jgi:integrase
LSFLSVLFRAAFEKGLLDEQPMKGMVKMMENSKQTFVPLSNDELSRLLTAAEQEGDGVMYEFTLSTGVRLRELLALSWNDIDFDKQTVTIKRNVSSFSNGREQIEQMRSGFRTITLSSNLLTRLKEHKEKQLTMEDSGEEYHELNLIFPNKNGGVQNPSLVRTKFHRLTDKANVRKITFHDLRKMHAYLLIETGMSFKQIQNRLGHKRFETTISKLYSLTK